MTKAEKGAAATVWSQGYRPGVLAELSPSWQHPATGRAMSPTPCFSSGPRPTAGACVRAQLKYRSPGCAGGRPSPPPGCDQLLPPSPRPTRSGKPCLAVSLRRLEPGGAAEPDTGLPVRGHPVRGSWPSAGQAGSAGTNLRARGCARAGPRAHIWAWALFGCAHTCADRGVAGRADLCCRLWG
uniref:Uncharacterized protein n=1 Tax=Molossus molossus TaxID=27622 RepID=A0A7J8HDP5_MOLMO|nr:hypothetical protein HJG59_011160 [Molossus molossus]